MFYTYFYLILLYFILSYFILFILFYSISFYFILFVAKFSSSWLVQPSSVELRFALILIITTTPTT